MLKCVQRGGECQDAGAGWNAFFKFKFLTPEEVVPNNSKRMVYFNLISRAKSGGTVSEYVREKMHE